MLIDMLIFRLTLGRPLVAQSSLFEARPRDFVRLELPANSDPRPNAVQGVARS
jgi:hypothetical protein